MNRRLPLAFLVAPGVVPAALACASAFPTYAGAWVIALPVAAFTYATAVLLGIPAYVIFSRQGWCNAWQFVLGGAALGVAPMLLLSPFAGFARQALAAGPIYIGIGAISGLFFWVVAFAGKRRAAT